MTKPSELIITKIRLAIEQGHNLELRSFELQRAYQALTQQRDALIETARAEVGAPIGHRLNLETQVFEAPTGPVPLSASPSRQQRRARKTA